MERAANTSMDLAVAEPAASRMLEAVRAVRILKCILIRERRMGFELRLYGNKCRERSIASDTVEAVMEIEEPGNDPRNPWDLLEKGKKCR